MKILVLDIGNASVKYALFQNDQIKKINSSFHKGQVKQTVFSIIKITNK